MRRQRRKPAYQRHPSKREVSSYTALLKASAERGDAKAACDLMKLRDAEQMVLQIDD